MKLEAASLWAWPLTTWSNRRLLTEMAEATNCRHLVNAVNAKAIGSYEAILYFI